MASDTLENLPDKWATFDGISSTLATYQHTCMMSLITKVRTYTV